MKNIVENECICCCTGDVLQRLVVKPSFLTNLS